MTIEEFYRKTHISYYTVMKLIKKGYIKEGTHYTMRYNLHHTYYDLLDVEFIITQAKAHCKRLGSARKY